MACHPALQAYLGRLGPTALGGAGAAIAAQYAFSKLYNDPLLRTTISLVAASDGAGTATAAVETSAGPGAEAPSDGEIAPSSSADATAAALLLALVVGIGQGLICLLFGGPVLRAVCVGPASPMRAEALGYLRACALGAPTVTLWLVANGIFRGLGDTSTPLLWSLVFCALNAIIDPFLIFNCRMGAAGAAAGTSIAQTLALVPLLLSLGRRQRARARPPAPPLGPVRTVIALFTPAGGVGALRSSLRQYASAGGLVLVRTLGKISAYSVVAREAARLGSVASAAHNLCFQLGVATTQLCESLAIATQAILAEMIAEIASRSRCDVRATSAYLAAQSRRISRRRCSRVSSAPRPPTAIVEKEEEGGVARCVAFSGARAHTASPSVRASPSSPLRT